MRPSLKSFAAVAAGTFVASVAAPAGVGAQTADDPLVTAAVQVSTDPNPTRGYSTPQIARNPVNGTLFIADCDARNSMTITTYTSTDEGRSWRPGGSPMTKPWVNACGTPDSNIDHTMAYDKDGVLYIAFQAMDPKFMNLPPRDRPLHIFLAKSTDDGQTFTGVKVWDAPEAPEADRGLKRNDRPWVAVDPNDPRFVYVSWMQFHTNDDVPSGNKALIAASSDGGKTFGKPFSLREGDPQGSYDARVAVDGKGVVHTTFAGRGRTEPVPAGQPAPPAPIRTVLYRNSTDHGATWSESKQIEEGNAGFTFNRKWGLKADPNNNNLYVTWYGNPNPRAARPQDDRDIYFRASYDGGKTWTDRKPLNTDIDKVNVQHLHPYLDIAPSGRLDVVWYDGRNSPQPEGTCPGQCGFQDVYLRSSYDGGRTWGKETKVTDRIIDRNYGIWSNNSDIHGPLGIVSTDDAAYVTWQDSRNGHDIGGADDTYFARVIFNDKAAAAADDDNGVPRGLLLAAGVAVGLGVAMVAAFALMRRNKAAKPATPAATT